MNKIAGEKTKRQRLTAAIGLFTAFACATSLPASELTAPHAFNGDGGAAPMGRSQYYRP